MSRRFIYSLVVSIMLPLALVAMVWAFANNKNPEMRDAKTKPFVPQGVWADVVSFPTVDLGFSGDEPTTGPLYLRRAAAVGYPPNGKVYIFGGRHRPDGTDIGSRWIWEYNPANNTLTQKNALLDTNFYGTRYVANMVAAVLTDTTGPHIYVVGGAGPDTVITSTVRMYDPTADTVNNAYDTWPANPPRIPGGYAVYNNKLYIFGGHVAKPTTQLFSDTWIFDPMMPAGSRWTQIAGANLSVPRAYIAGAQLDGYIYAIGGDQVISNTATPLSIVERMDPSQGSPTWQPVASLPFGKGDMSAWAYNTGTGYEISGRIVIAGGGYPVPDTSAFIYDPGTNSWSVFPDMLRPRRNYAAAQLNGMLYAWGGYDVQGNTYNGSNSNMSYNASSPPPPPGITPTNTPSPVPTTCAATSNYTYTVSTGASINPGTTLVPGSNCQTCMVNLTLPFSVQLYGRNFTKAVVGSTGNMQFGSDSSFWINRPLPWDPYRYTLFPFWDDLNLTGTGHGIYTSVSGSAPNRIFNVEWRGTANDFEIRLYEGLTSFEFIYGTGSGGTATIGVQKDLSYYTQAGYNVAQPAAGTKYAWSAVPCGGTATPTSMGAPPTATRTSTPINTVPATSTPSDTATIPPATTTATAPSATNTTGPGITPSATHTTAPGSTPSATSTNAPSVTPGTPSATATACNIEFADVPPGSTFYPFIYCLACHGIVNGYPDRTFRFNNPVTRGQLSKILSNSAGFSDPPGAQIFEDVVPGSTFYDFIQRLASRGYISGYPCGDPGEPCVPPDNRPYFRPNNNASRGQLSKIASNAAGFSDPPGAQIFEDVVPGSTFYDFIQRLANRGYISGYPCGFPGEPCLPPGNRSYFRPNNSVTRGQTTKIAANTFMRDCDLP